MSAASPTKVSYETLRAIYAKFNPNGAAAPNDEELYAMFASVFQEKNLLPKQTHDFTIRQIVSLIKGVVQPETYTTLDTLYRKLPRSTIIRTGDTFPAGFSEEDHPVIKLTDGYFPGTDDLLELINQDLGQTSVYVAICTRLRYNPVVKQKHLLYCRTRAVADLLLLNCAVVKPENSSAELRFILALLRQDSQEANLIYKNARTGQNVDRSGSNEKPWFRWINGLTAEEEARVLGVPLDGTEEGGGKRRRLVGEGEEKIKNN